ncbi:kinase-like domain-containing protein [Rhizophagus irregularis DAOM 181602=DAOM 197198]|nr:kinase-like domain-containing protein [Rhizophagus irregularis DAOM 181602=DAOM 197198]
MDEKPKDLWKYDYKSQHHVTIPTIDSTIESENVDERVVYIEDLEKRKQAYGICGECKEPGTGRDWCQSYFLNEIKSHLQIYLEDIVQCFGITQDPNNKEPTTKELYQTLDDLYSSVKNSEIRFQIEEYNKIREEKFKNRSNEDESKSFKTHPQAIYTSRLLSFKNLPKPVNSSDLSSFQFSSDTNYTAQSTSTNPISECLDVQLSELELNEIYQDSEHNIE